MSRQIIRPLPGYMQHAQNKHRFIDDAVGHNIGQARHDKFARIAHPAGTATEGIVDKLKHVIAYRFIDFHRRLGAIRPNVVKNLIAIDASMNRPFDPHV